MKLQNTFRPVVIFLCGWAISNTTFAQQSRGIVYADGVPEISNGILNNLKKPLPDIIKN